MEPIISINQALVLEEFRKNSKLINNFYFTGGTALANYYFHHRYSVDLDFFSDKPFGLTTTIDILNQWSKKLDFTYKLRTIEDITHIFNLTFDDNSVLKVDFAYYPYKRLEKGVNDKGIEIDSLKDIATNKLISIIQRSEVKDFVDLYFLLQRYTVWDLIYAVETKFHMELDILFISANFEKVQDFEFLPRMILPLTIPTLKEFFKQQAKKLSSKVIE